MPLHRLFLDMIGRHAMIVRGDAVLAAVSGGPDSTALLDLLARESPRLGFRLAVAHLDHKLRGAASREDRIFVEGIARLLGLPCFCAEADVRGLARMEKRSLEEAGRIARMRFLHQVAKEWGARSIALGHQRDDQAEGVLMRVLQGAGSSGLAAIRPVVRLDGGLVMIRPLLSASRGQILAYLDRRGLSFRLDESNADPAFLRNRVRSRLLPLLEEGFNPRVREALVRSAEILRDEDECLASLSADWMARFATRQGEPQEAIPRAILLPETPLAQLPVALRRRVLRESLASVGATPRKIRFDQIETLLGLAARGRTGARVVFAGGYVARLEYGQIILERSGAADGPEGGKERAWPARRLVVPGETPLPLLPAHLRCLAGVSAPADRARLLTSVIEPSELKEPLRSGAGSVAHLDFHRTGPALTVRLRRTGDRFHPLGSSGSKKLSDFLIDVRLPREQRDLVPLLVAAGSGQRQPQPPVEAEPKGDPEGEIGLPGGDPETVAWVVGIRISERFRVTERTRRVLRVELSADPDGR